MIKTEIKVKRLNKHIIKKRKISRTKKDKVWEFEIDLPSALHTIEAIIDACKASRSDLLIHIQNWLDDMKNGKPFELYKPDLNTEISAVYPGIETSESVDITKEELERDIYEDESLDALKSKA